MEYISKETVQDLLSVKTDAPVATIYAPMHTTLAPQHISENQIRLKNLLHDAAHQLEQANCAKLPQQLKDLQTQLYSNLDFWKSQTPGVLVCAAVDNIKIYHLPIDTEEYVAVDTNFHVGPILGLLDEQRDFYVLTVTQHNPVLLKGNSYELQKAKLDLPPTVEAALNLDEANSRTENQGSATGSSMNTGWFNGRGGARDPKEGDRARFFRLIDKMVSHHINAAPLLLAGVETEVSEYRHHAKYSPILQGIIPGSPNHTSLEELHHLAKEIIQHELVEPSHQAIIQEYEHMEGANPERAASDKKTILSATKQGRVDKLLLGLTRRSSDIVRDSIGARLRLTFPEPEINKSLNDISIKVWQMSGSVITLPIHKMPHGAPILARLRY